MTEADGLPHEPEAIGALGGHFATAPLLAGTSALAEALLGRLRDLLEPFARRHRAAWNALVEQVQSGAVDQREYHVPGSAFRPTFHARVAQEHFEAERWTESFLRFINAGEVLLGQVFLPELKQAGLSIETGKAGWFTRFETWAREEGLRLDRSAEFAEFKRVYRIRSTRLAHGRDEASMSEALDAKRAYENLVSVLRENFGKRYGVTLEGIQQKALVARGMLLERADIDRVVELTEEARRIVNDARTEWKELVNAHHPMQPATIRDAMDAMPPEDRRLADKAFEVAMREDFALITQVWAAASDAERLFGEIVDEIVAKEAT